jgi:tetratricopeptide (TPR) repeat protein
MTTPSPARLLHESGGISVFHRPGTSAWTLVTFGPRWRVLREDRWWGVGLGLREGIDVIGVAATEHDWYPRDTMAALLPVIRAAAKPAVVTYGAGMGGYGALKYATALGARGALALSAHYSIDPADGTAGDRDVAHFDPARHRDMRIDPGDYPDGSVLMWDPNALADDVHARALAQLPGIRPVKLRLTAHAGATLFTETNRLVPVAEALLDGRQAEAIAGIRAARREAPKVLLAAAALLEAHGHARWAAEALRRAEQRPARAPRPGAARPPHTPRATVPPPAPSARPPALLLGETENIRLWHWPGEGPETLVIFTPAGWSPAAVPGGWWGHGLVERLGWSAIIFAAHQPSWYPAAEMATLLPLALAAAPPGRRITFGQGMGGYGALKYGRALAAEATVALAPAFSIDPADMPADRRARVEFDPQRNAGMAVRPADLAALPIIAFDPLLRPDLAQAQRLAAMSPIRAVPLRRGGGALAALLGETGRLAPLLRATLEGDAPGAVAILREARRASPRLRAAVAKALEARGHHAWSLALRGQAVALPESSAPPAVSPAIGRRFAIQARALNLQKKHEAEAEVIRQWIAAVPDAEEPRLSLARCLQLLGRIEEAAAGLINAVRDGFGGKRVHVALVRLQRRLDRPLEAVAAAEAAVAAVPGDVALLVLLGETCLWAAREAEAEAAFRQALQVEPGHQQAQLGLAVLEAMTQQDAEVAGPHLTALMEALAARMAPETEWLQVADRFDRAELFDAAIVVMVEALRLHPRARPLAKRHGQILLRAEREEAAIICFRQIVEAEPDDATAWYPLLDALAALQRHTEGRHVAVQAVAAHPEDAVIATRHAGFLNELKEAAAAHREARRAVALAPMAEATHLMLIAVLRRQARLRDAMQAARAALEILPESAGIALALARLLLDVNDFDGAAQAFRLATTMPGSPRSAWTGEVEALEAAGRIKEAEDAARRGLAAQPDNKDLRVVLGQLLLARGETDAARDSLAEAIAEEAASPAVNLAMADALLRQGRRREALQLLVNARAAAPDHVQTEIRLGQLLLDLGQVEEAAEIFTRLTEAMPELPAAWVGLSDAERLRKRIKPALAAYRQAIAVGVDAAALRNLRYRLFGEHDG